jgi:hypothetical protein
MNAINFLLIALFTFLAPSKGYCPLPREKSEVARALIHLARLGKGRVLALFIKEGMILKEVEQLLGGFHVTSGTNAHYNACWDAYGISVDFSHHDGAWRVSHYVPWELRWENLVRHLKASNVP